MKVALSLPDSKVGKTQTAHELHKRLPGSFVCDPEQLGFGIQRMTPPELRGDFQDVPLWREGIYQLLDQAHPLTRPLWRWAVQLRHLRRD